MSEQTAKRPHDVFISYASENKAVADAIVADFEKNGIRCWYAPRDIRAGTNYMDALVGAIKNAGVIVLVYSDKSNESKYVLNEISIAFEEGKTIVPFRLADIQMGNALSFCLKGVHWMDATTPPLLKNITTLREHVSSIIGSPSPQPTPPLPPSEPWWVKYRIPLAISAMVIIGLMAWFATRNKVTTQKDDGTVVHSPEEEQKEDNIDSSEELTQKPDEDTGKEQETVEESESLGKSDQIQEADVDSGGNTAQSTHTSDSSNELTDTWEEIIEAGNDGTYKEKYQIGDTKEIDIGSESITMKLVAMDEDELADGSGKAHMTWVADELLQEEHYMNDTDTKEGGWEASGMRSWLREDILPLMPEEVQRGIKEVNKYSYSTDVDGDIKTEDKIWIPSQREVFLGDHDESWTKDQTGAAYTEVFNSDESRIRSRAGASDTSDWWLRSACIFYSSGSFECVHPDGGLVGRDASFEGGVVVGFCL